MRRSLAPTALVPLGLVARPDGSRFPEQSVGRFAPGPDPPSGSALLLIAATAGASNGPRKALSDNARSQMENPATRCTTTICRVRSGRRDWTRTNDPHHVKVVL